MNKDHDGTQDVYEESDFSTTEERLELERLEREEALARTADDWFTLGVNAFLQGAYQQSINYFDQVLEKEPKNAKAYVNRGDVYREFGEYDEAMNDYEMAVFCGSKEAQHILDEFKEELEQIKKQKENRN